MLVASSMRNLELLSLMLLVPAQVLRSASFSSCSPVSPAGLVFFAFGLNMVDCGGLLGGRLGKDAQKVVKARADPGIGRTMTL